MKTPFFIDKLNMNLSITIFPENEIQTMLILIIITEVKSTFKPSGPSGRSLSRFL